MGVPSVGILLHELIKLMYHARVKDPVFFRIGNYNIYKYFVLYQYLLINKGHYYFIGTCGGIGIDGGTVVISEEAVDGLLRSTYETVNNFIKIAV